MSNRPAELPQSQNIINSLPSELIQALESQSVESLTPTQVQSLPAILKGDDVAVQAKTGSGKTWAFALGILNKYILAKSAGGGSEASTEPSSLVLCPTRELAEQVSEQIRVLAKFIPNTKILAIYGGTAIGHQLASLKHAPSVLVATPGRLLDVMSKRKVTLDGVKTLVLDEADRMLDMGFSEQVDQILEVIENNNQRVQTMLFSATFGQGVEAIAKRFTKAASVVKLETEANRAISQTVWVDESNQSDYLTAALLTEHQPKSCMVFCNTKAKVAQVYEYLNEQGFDVVSLQGELSQQERDIALRKFSSDCANIVVATDVASRGLDIKGVDLVINVEVSPEVETHTHRIGRTGRAGETGIAATIITPEQRGHIEKIAAFTEAKFSFKGAQSLRFHKNRIRSSAFVGIHLSAGKKQKISKTDVLGAITKQGDVDGADVGKIFVQAQQSFVAIKQRSVKRVLTMFREQKVKGKKIRARKV